jgi:hypothetical protein
MPSEPMTHAEKVALDEFVDWSSGQAVMFDRRPASMRKLEARGIVRQVGGTWTKPRYEMVPLEHDEGWDGRLKPPPTPRGRASAPPLPGHVHDAV